MLALVHPAVLAHTPAKLGQRGRLHIKLAAVALAVDAARLSRNSHLVRLQVLTTLVGSTSITAVFLARHDGVKHTLLEHLLQRLELAEEVSLHQLLLALSARPARAKLQSVPLRLVIVLFVVAVDALIERQFIR